MPSIFSIFFGFLALLDFPQLIRKIFWDPPFIFGTPLARDLRSSALESGIFELKKVCWGGGRQTPPFFSTNFFLKIFEIHVKKICHIEFFFIFGPDIPYGPNIFGIFLGTIFSSNFW